MNVRESRPQPLKPEKHDVSLLFPKSGGVKRITRAWPRTKEQQELEAAQAFARALELRTGRRLLDLQTLGDEAGHDVEAREGERRVEIQVAELVTRGLAWQPDPRYDGWELDEAGIQDMLPKVVHTKLKKHYAKVAGTHLILLVYSIDPFADKLAISEVHEGDKVTTVIPDGVLRAQELVRETPGPFDEVWYVIPAPAGVTLLVGILPAQGP